jgi:hypothetical protein
MIIFSWKWPVRAETCSEWVEWENKKFVAIDGHYNKVLIYLYVSQTNPSPLSVIVISITGPVTCYRLPVHLQWNTVSQSAVSDGTKVSSQQRSCIPCWWAMSVAASSIVLQHSQPYNTLHTLDPHHVIAASFLPILSIHLLLAMIQHSVELLAFVIHS